MSRVLFLCAIGVRNAQDAATVTPMKVSGLTPRAELAALARTDWRQFLRCRADELRPGGILIVSTLGSIPDDSGINGIRASARKLYRAIFQVANQMVADGLLEASALDHFVFPLWFPTAEEARAPISQEPDLKETFDQTASCASLVMSTVKEGTTFASHSQVNVAMSRVVAIRSDLRRTDAGDW